MFKTNFSKKIFLVIFVGLIVVLVTAGLGCKEPAEEEVAPSPPVAKPVERLTEETEPSEVEEPGPVAKPQEEVEPIEEVTPEEEKPQELPLTAEDEQALVLKQAEKIAQIYGTYATTDDPPFKNLRDLKDFGTDAFNSWLDTIIKDVAPSGPFHGWATEAISSAILESSFDSMEILITCKKEEFLETQRAPKVGYKMLKISFKKVGEDWKVDRAEWIK